MHTITDETFEAAKAKAHVLLLELSARWCPPCRAIEPHLHALEAERGDVVFATVDVDDNPDTAAKLGVRAMPTMLLFVDGAVVAHLVGAQPKAKLAAWIDAHVPRSPNAHAHAHANEDADGGVR
mgnify:CR=1 FL=1